VILACWLRWALPQRAARISNLLEIAFLFFVAIVHNRLPELAGTHVCGMMCIAFGLGAAVGAFATELERAYSLAVPVTLLVIVLLLCEQKPVHARA
jgi:uncharacterized membrane protein YoaK (UPF0700 family)